MDFNYTPEQDALRAAIVAFARASLNEGVIERDREQVFSRDLFRACASHGLTGLPIDKRYGGQGLDATSSAIALEALGYACTDHGLVFSVAAHLLSCVVPLSTFGTPTQRSHYLPRLCDGSWIGALAMTEADSGSDSSSLRTSAVRDGQGWRLNGAKAFIANGPQADVIVAVALTDPVARFHGGMTAFLVDRGAAGLELGGNIERMGLRTMQVGNIKFDSVWAPDEAVLGGVGGGAGVFTTAMDWERTCLFAAHVGQIERLMEHALSHARTREIGGHRIGKYQAVSHKIADMKVRLEAARLLTYRAAGRLGTTRAVSLDAALAKLFVSEALVETAVNTIQILGAHGYATATEAERGLRDAVAAKIYSGTSEVQRNVIASWLGL